MSQDPSKFPDQSIRENIPVGGQVGATGSGGIASRIRQLQAENEQLRREKNEIEIIHQQEVQILKEQLQDIQEQLNESEDKSKKAENLISAEKQENIKQKEEILIEKENEKRKVEQELRKIHMSFLLDVTQIVVLVYTENMATYAGQDWGGGTVYYIGTNKSGNKSFTDNQIIKAEYDSEKGTLIFFVDGVQQPIYITGIKEKVRFIISMYFAGATCTIRSLKKLAKPTSGHVPNEQIVQW
ncbi:MAG: hypothetical protein EZS28_033107 [Streblomastix strix]|uniref:SPRY domain-containing protein n=1 Tax=Streblomastix strix TaxID=222440 RepID=A0A5J4UL22_9EUKA|nr:MAG: hypothetical protein EZS28_033107 [Streblomastix strix]